jgi:hypothetical protein
VQQIQKAHAVKTFLEFVIESELGPPCSRSSGRSTWHCPFHDDGTPSFCTRPVPAGGKERWKCYGCGLWGDEHDFLKGMGVRDYGDRLNKLRELREAYERDQPTDDTPLIPQGTGSTPRYHVCILCRMKDRDYNPEVEADSEDANRAVAGILECLNEPQPKTQTDQSVALRRMKACLELCAAHDLHPLALAARLGWEIWIREGDAKHMAECDDPRCENSCCRRRREAHHLRACNSPKNTAQNGPQFDDAPYVCNGENREKRRANP